MRSPFMAISEEDKNLNISLKSVKSGGRQVIYNSGYGEGNSHNLNLWECENLKKKRRDSDQAIQHSSKRMCRNVSGCVNFKMF